MKKSKLGKVTKSVRVTGVCVYNFKGIREGPSEQLTSEPELKEMRGGRAQKPEAGRHWCEQLEATSRQQGAESEGRGWGDTGTRTWLARMVAWTLSEPGSHCRAPSGEAVTCHESSNGTALAAVLGQTVRGWRGGRGLLGSSYHCPSDGGPDPPGSKGGARGDVLANG